MTRRSDRSRTPEAAAARRELRGQLTDAAPVMEAALALLAVRARSVAETRKRLARLGYPETLIEDVVVRLVEMEYLDDEEFGRAWVESRDRARPRGESGLRRELALKGVPRDVVDSVIAGRASDSGEDPDRIAAVALVKRRRGALEREIDPFKRRQKAYALLARNGFSPDVCREVAATVAVEASDD